MSVCYILQLIFCIDFVMKANIEVTEKKQNNFLFVETFHGKSIPLFAIICTTAARLRMHFRDQAAELPLGFLSLFLKIAFPYV